MIHHVLMNANIKLLEYLIENFEDAGLSFNQIMIEGNNALHLALSASAFKKYRKRCEDCVQLIMQTENDRVLEDDQVEETYARLDINA